MTPAPSDLLQSARELQADRLRHLLDAGMSPLAADRDGASALEHLAADERAAPWLADASEWGDQWRGLMLRMAQAAPQTVAERAARTRALAAAVYVLEKNALIAEGLIERGRAQDTFADPAAYAPFKKIAEGSGWLIAAIQQKPLAPNLPPETAADTSETEQALLGAKRRAKIHAEAQLDALRMDAQGRVSPISDAAELTQWRQERQAPVAETPPAPAGRRRSP